MTVEQNPDDFLNVRETAKLLGVHENTVRNWVKSGALPDAKVSGSNFHRFRREDVERMRNRKKKATSQSDKQLNLIGPELVDGTQLNRWAETKAAQVRFPELMRRLLASTPGVDRILIRAGEGVAIGGWDGSAVSKGSKFLPAGDLRFEFGVDQKIKAKADDEWERHLTDGQSPATFVFATPRRWGNAQSWATQRRAEGKFADVWVIDADVLEGWLVQVPAVHQWISEQLGRRPSDAQSLEAWWDRFNARTKPQLPVGLFLAGRNDQALQLQKFVDGPAGLLTIKTEWASDAKAFTYAATRAIDEQAAQVSVIVVKTAEVWDRIVAERSHAILIPDFEDANVAGATSNGHHVVLILDQATASTQRPDLVLTRLERIAAAESLQAAGVSFELAQRYAAFARRNPQAFIRSISANPAYARPTWTEHPLAIPLSRLILVGEWTTGDNDVKLIEKLVGKPWEAIEQDLAQVSDTDDPVFRKVGNHWSLTSPGEAFYLLAPTLKLSDLTTWKEVIRTCLLETDPTLDLSDDDQVMAGIRGVRREHSSAIRKGMARSAALLGARGDGIELANGRTLADEATHLLGEIFEEAVADASGRKWEELADVLSLLAEAAPDAFLDALGQDLSRAQPGVVRLFQDAKQSSAFSFGPSSPHPWLLWAIETVTWSPEHFPDGVLLLVKLAKIDPGGRTTNRPIESLATVLCGWVRNTSADVAQKIAALTVVRAADPDVCWDLLLKLLPSDHGFMTPPASPRVREWQPTSSSVLMSEWVTYTHAVVQHAVELAAGNPERVVKLVEDLGNLPPTDQAKVLDLLRASASSDSGLDGELRFQLWEPLHEIVARHERFSTTAWAFDSETIGQLKSVLADLEPATDPKRFAYLFDWHPDLPEIDPHDIAAHDALLLKLQSEAIDELASSPAPTDAFEALAKQARVPSHVGWALAGKDQLGMADVAPWLGSSEPNLREAGSAWFDRMVQSHGPSWLEQALATYHLGGDARTLAIRSIPSQRDLWDVLAARSSDADTYWELTYIRAFRIPVEDVKFAVERLVAHDRAWAAVQVLADAIHPAAVDGKTRAGTISTELVLETLSRAIAEDPQPRDVSNMTSYYVGQLLDYLDAVDTDDSVMARLEFAFFRLLDHTREPRVLSATLAKDPEIFVDLAKRVYHGKNDPKSDPSEHEHQLANQAWWVLNGWTGFPGRRDDGTIDADVLNSWVKVARLQFSESDRADIGDEIIGESFGHSPVGTDGAWPAEPIRDLIETIGSERMESGLIIGRRNTRGVTTRGAYDGGAQERALAEQYRGWSKIVKSAWPRTGRLLRLIADGYDDDARREDIRAELDADRD